MDVYGDKRGILADCVDELQPFIEEVLPNEEQDNVLVTESMDVVINAKSAVTVVSEKAGSKSKVYKKYGHNRNLENLCSFLAILFIFFVIQ